MKIQICCDEKYPNYTIEKDSKWFLKSQKIISITEKKLQEIENVFEKYEEVQKYLKKLAGDGFNE